MKNTNKISKIRRAITAGLAAAMMMSLAVPFTASADNTAETAAAAAGIQSDANYYQNQVEKFEKMQNKQGIQIRHFCRKTAEVFLRCKVQRPVPLRSSRNVCFRGCQKLHIML